MGQFTFIEKIIMLIIFLVALILVIVGQLNDGMMWLLIELVGVVMLILDLYLYNRKFR